MLRLRWPAFLKRLGHRLFLAYAHYRWRRWRRPWLPDRGPWRVVVPDEEMSNEKVVVLTWFNLETGRWGGICEFFDDSDLCDYVPMEDRIAQSEYFPLLEQSPVWVKADDFSSKNQE